MECSLQVMSKRVWSMVRVAFFMLKKELSKGKSTMNLNMMFKQRSKLAGKAIFNLLFHHHHGGSTSSRRCHDSLTFSRGKRHRSHIQNNLFTFTRTPPASDDEAVTMSAMKTIMDMFSNDQAIAEAFPALSEFERSPTVRQLRVSDSPFPLRDDDDEDNQIDKAAEDFIKRFYSQLRKQD